MIMIFIEEIHKMTDSDSLKGKKLMIPKIIKLLQRWLVWR